MLRGGRAVGSAGLATLLAAEDLPLDGYTWARWPRTRSRADSVTPKDFLQSKAIEGH